MLQESLAVHWSRSPVLTAEKTAQFSPPTVKSADMEGEVTAGYLYNTVCR